MCGRYSLFTPPATLEDRFEVSTEDYEPTYNAAPGQQLPVVSDTDVSTLDRMEWGFVPAWADDRDGHINARAETLRERPSFRDAFTQQTEGRLAAGRCLVPADGFYEWADENGHKQPYRVGLDDNRPFAMAGLWSQWRPKSTQTGLDTFGAVESEGTDAGPDGEPDIVETYAIITTEPNDVVAELHDRMAAILPPDRERAWLMAPPDEAAALLEPYPETEMQAYPVSRAVNNPTNDEPELIEPVS